jgi:hypothetical protein
MIFEFKGHSLSNSLAVFNYYKGLTGRSLENDLRQMQRLERVMNNPDATDEDIDAAQNAVPLDITETIQYVYYAMRCAAERKDLELSTIIDEVDITDLADGTLQEALTKLVDVKKKEIVQKAQTAFISRKR